MIIERAEVVQVRLPLRAPYRTSFGEMTAIVGTCRTVG